MDKLKEKKYKERSDYARQLIKNTAINKISKMYHPLNKRGYDYYGDQSFAEQREYEIECIIKKMNKDLAALKVKFKNAQVTSMQI